MVAKEFLKPTKGKIIIFVLYILGLIYLFYYVGQFWGGTDIGLLALLYPFFPSNPIFVILDPIYGYIISCIIVYLVIFFRKPKSS